MSTKQTAIMLQLATATGESKQQMVVFAGGAVFRRSMTDGTRTRWRHATPREVDTWTEGFVNLAGAGPKPMSLSHGLTLMEVTSDEVTEAEGTGFARNVGLRFTRVIEAMDADPSSVPPFAGDVGEFIAQWRAANDSDDNAWLDRHIHPAGTARPAPAPVAAPEPEEEIEVPALSHGWTYPATVGGYITRPNGQRYRVRKLDGTPDVQIVRDARADREHVFTFGEPGTGKTALFDAAFGTDMVTMLGTEDVEVADFIGGWVLRGGSYVWVDGAMVEAMDRGVPLFVDEIGVIFPKVLTGLFSVMDGRDEIRITANPDRGIVKAQPGFFVLGATNPHAPGVRISEALLSRFAIHLEVGTDYAMMRELGVPDPLVTAAENLEARRKTGAGVGWAPQARELLRASAQWTKRGDLFAVRNLISSAPEDDREQVAEQLARTTGHKVTGLVL